MSEVPEIKYHADALATKIQFAPQLIFRGKPAMKTREAMNNPV